MVLSSQNEQLRGFSLLDRLTGDGQKKVAMRLNVVS